MRTSDWSSDVCSSDLNVFTIPKRQVRHELGGNGGVQVAKGLPIDVRVDDLGNGDAEVARQRCLGAGHDVDGNVVEIASDLHEQSSFRSEEHTSELQSLMRISYDVFCLKKKTKMNKTTLIQ